MKEIAEFEAIIAAIGDGVSIQDVEFRILYQNEVLKKTAGDHVGEYCYQGYQKKDRVCENCPMVMAFQDGRTHTLERTAHADHGVVHVEITASPLRDTSGGIIAGIVVVRDITARKRTEEQLQKSEERFRQLFEQNGDALFLFKRENGEILDANPAAVNLYGYTKEEFMGNTSSLFLKSPDELRKFRQALCDPGTANSIRIDRLTTTRKDGTNVAVSIWGNIVRLKESDVLTCSFRDITEKMQLEEEAKLIRAKLIQTNKMTSLGTLVSGVAHEINNPNNFIMFNAHLLADIWKDVVTILTEYYGENVDFPIGNIPFAEMREIIPKLLSGISEGSRRINDIVENLKNYIRQDRSSLQGQVDIRKMITAATSILGNQIRKHTENYNLIFDENLPLIRGSAQQLEQVIINLIMNALQALPDRTRGIWISTTLDAEIRKVLIQIKDEGIGMPADVLERIPEPFFTTKRDLGGTGLGLSISYSILKDHGGSLKFESEPGNGTVVSIELPME